MPYAALPLDCPFPFPRPVSSGHALLGWPVRPQSQHVMEGFVLPAPFPFASVVGGMFQLLVGGVLQLAFPGLPLPLPLTFRGTKAQRPAGVVQ